MKAIIFTRVSSKEQEDGHSIPAQVRRLTEYALKKNLEIDAENIFQITESSSKKRRKEFDRVIARIKSIKEPIALITDTVDRLQRSFRETPLLDELRKEGRLEMHFLREGLILSKASNSSDLMRWDMGVMFSSGYVRQLSDNVKRSQEQCVKNGQWISKAPYGYKNVSLPSSQRTIEIDQEQAACVIKIFELYAEGNNSYQTIADKMRIIGFAKTSRGKSVTARTVELILNNPFYMGMMYVKEQLHPHKYPPLISEWLYNKVQATIANHHKVPVQYAGKPILLRGFIRCGRCGGTVCGDIKKQKYIYYSCHNAKRMCIKKWIKEETILTTILPYFDNISLTDEQVAEIVEYIQDNEAQSHTSARQIEQQTLQKLNTVQERLSKLVDMHIDGTIDSTTYSMKLEEYKKEKYKLTEQLNGYKGIDKADLIAARDVLELAQEAREIFESSKLEEKQQLLNFFFSNFTLNDEKLDLELREPFRVMQKIQDQHVWRPLVDVFRNDTVTMEVSANRIQTVFSSFGISTAIV